MNGIVGNAELCEKLCLDVLSDKLSHACILEGGAGTGKHTIAKNVAAALACHNKDHASLPFPCRSCIGCKKVFEDKSPDVIIVNRGDNATLGVEVIRDLKRDVYTVPNDLDFKLYIIEEADKMTTEAQNAFLLTLEEPPSFVRFILLCECAEKLLETIRSRAPILRTAPISNEDIEKYVCETDRRASQLKLSAPRELSEIIVASKNSIGTAIKYLDSQSFAPIKDARALASDFLSAALSHSTKELVSIIPQFAKKRDGAARQLTCLSEAVTDLLLLKKSDDAPLCFFADRERAIELCDSASVSFLYGLAVAVVNALDSLARNSNVRLTLVNLLCDAQLI
jgi:DNA polymerase-3 subunit delta'